MYKRIIFAFLFSLLFLPLIQETFHVFNFKPLNGYEIKTEKDSLSAASWFKGSFQKNRQKYVEENIGFRDLVVRIYNQINYTAFHVTESPGVVLGKDNFLYLTSYTENYNGNRFIGHDAIESNSSRLKKLQDALKEKNIDLITVFAPGKASFYPEYIPDESAKPLSVNNYLAYKKAFQEKGVNFIT